MKIPTQEKIRKWFSAFISVFVVASLILPAFPDNRAEAAVSSQIASAVNSFEGYELLADSVLAVANNTMGGVIVGLTMLTNMLGLQSEVVETTNGYHYYIQPVDIYQDPEFIAVYGEGQHLTAYISDNYDFLYTAPDTYSTSQFIAEDWQTPQARAASGYDSLSPIEGVFIFTRNLASGLLATILVVIGIMIMFQYRAGGQALVTLQNSLPRVLVGLILIYTSIYLVGIVIDISNALIGYIGHAIESECLGVGREWCEISNPWGLAIGMLWTFVDASFVDFNNYDGLQEWFGGAHNTIGGVLLVLIFTFVFLGLAFRIWFMLLSTYAKVFIDVITLPLDIVFAVIPGNEKSGINAFKRTVANIAVFPVSYFLFKLAIDVAQQGDIPIPESLKVFNGGEVAIGSSVPANEFFSLIRMNAMIMYGILVLIPSVPALMEEIFQVQSSRVISDAQTQGIARIPIVGKKMAGK